MNYFELKRAWGEGHIEIKPVACRKRCLFTHLTSINACYFDGTKIRKRYLGSNIKNAFDIVQEFKSHILNGQEWYRENYWRLLW